MFDMTASEYDEYIASNAGGCTQCGEIDEDNFYEPDAKFCDCPMCGAQMSVYGIEELLLMGQINFVDEEE